MAQYMLGRQYGTPPVVVCRRPPLVHRKQGNSTLRAFPSRLVAAASTLARILQPRVLTTSLSIHITDSRATPATTRLLHGMAGRRPTARVTCGRRHMLLLPRPPMLAQRTAF